MKLSRLRTLPQAAQWVVSRVDGLPASQEKVAVWGSWEFVQFQVVSQDSAQTSPLSRKTRKRLLQKKSSEVLALTMGKRRVAFNAPSNGSMGSRIHGTCAPSGTCCVSMNARLYESSNVLEVTDRLGKEVNSPQSSTTALREVPDSSRANRIPRGCTDSGPHVAQVNRLDSSGRDRNLFVEALCCSVLMRQSFAMTDACVIEKLRPPRRRRRRGCL